MWPDLPYPDWTNVAELIGSGVLLVTLYLGCVVLLSRLLKRRREEMFGGRNHWSEDHWGEDEHA